MNSDTRLKELMDTFFTYSINLSKTATIKVINDYIRETKNGGHVNDWPIQLTIHKGRCTDMRLGTGYSHEHPIDIWRHKYSTNKDIKYQVNQCFEDDATYGHQE